MEVASGGIASAREGVSLPLSSGGITASLSKSHASTSLSGTVDWPLTLDELLNLFVSLLPEFVVLCQYFPLKRANLQSRVDHEKKGFGNKRRL